MRVLQIHDGGVGVYKYVMGGGGESEGFTDR